MAFCLQKMDTQNGDPIVYFLLNQNEPIKLNNLIGKTISFSFTGHIFCSNCQKETNKSFGEGFCFSCFSTAAAASPCILRPELCQAHLGLGRDPAYEQKNHNQPHLVYLAQTDQLKVGITRKTQMPTRWIDQGAAAAIVLAEVPNRYLSGILEVALKDQFSDKTNWQQMLKNSPYDGPDLAEIKWELEQSLPADLSQYWTDDEKPWHFNYPVLNYPNQVKSISLDKTPNVSGVLSGIRGQYLIFENDTVINIRRHTGYQIIWED
ncbi:MAG: DUF2797 domain-containing protein [Sphingomonadales bacterium]|nr:DUF2797 domain-containing protein [Sphingomonadales bacterium]